VRKRLVEEFGYRNPMEVPKLSKIVINRASAGRRDQKKLDAAYAELTMNRGPEAGEDQGEEGHRGFKIREGMAIGTKVTRRQQRMYEFLDRLVTIALPRQRDFRGLPGTRASTRGNFSLA